ncbi:MAG: hypothetical protein SFV17_22000 [Candidatus Obscuribacter sp.]|nr:hypothetical protein [Candidatus Obscuribacter sp.]
MAKTDHSLDVDSGSAVNVLVQEKLEASYKLDSQPEGAKRSKSSFLAALALFAVLSVGLSLNQFEKLKPGDFPVNTWTTWAITDFLQEKPKNDVVFLGSSLMLVPLDGVDADFLGKPIDASAHHRSLYFEDAFKKDTGHSLKSYNFALPGEMPSDAYLITDFLLKQEKAPKVLVYGVGPRDFMDNLLPSPAATDPYRYLSRFGSLESHAGLLMPDWQERFNYELTRVCYIYGNRGQLALDVNRGLKAFLDRAARRPEVMSEADRVALRRKLLPDYLPYEVNRKECFFRPTTEATRGGFQDNVAEYRKRYKTLKMSTFTAQMQFLKDLIAIANERGTHVVLVAMPITQVNRDLLPDSSWALYKNSLREVASTGKSVTFHDMHETGKFKLSDFQDTVHLHSGGGAKLLFEVSKLMSADAATKQALGLTDGTP